MSFQKITLSEYLEILCGRSKVAATHYNRTLNVTAVMFEVEGNGPAPLQFLGGHWVALKVSAQEFEQLFEPLTEDLKNTFRMAHAQKFDESVRLVQLIAEAKSVFEANRIMSLRNSVEVTRQACANIIKSFN